MCSQRVQDVFSVSLSEKRRAQEGGRREEEEVGGQKGRKKHGEQNRGGFIQHSVFSNGFHLSPCCHGDKHRMQKCAC